MAHGARERPRQRSSGRPVRRLCTVVLALAAALWLGRAVAGCQGACFYIPPDSGVFTCLTSPPKCPPNFECVAGTCKKIGDGIDAAALGDGGDASVDAGTNDAGTNDAGTNDAGDAGGGS